MELGVVLCINVEVSNLIPVPIGIRPAVLRLVVDEVLSALCMIVNWKLRSDEMSFPRKLCHKLPVEISPVIDCNLKRPVKESPRVDRIVKVHACQVGDSARFLIHSVTFDFECRR